MIIDNVTILLPYLKTSSKIAAAVIANGATIYVITMGPESAVRACVFGGGPDGLMKLIQADEADDVPAALRSLLGKTSCMLQSCFNTVSKRNRVDSAVGLPTPASTPRGFSSKLIGPATPAFSTPAKARTSISKSKAEARAQSKTLTHHVRNKSDTDFFNAAKVNNETFQETCGEPNIDGKDSGFLSRDGEIHPNRSFVLDGDAVPVEEGDEIFF